MRSLGVWGYSWFFFFVPAQAGILYAQRACGLRYTAWEVRFWESCTLYVPFGVFFLIAAVLRRTPANPTAAIVGGLVAGIVQMLFFLLLRGHWAKKLPASVGPFVTLAASTAGAVLVALYVPALMG